MESSPLARRSLKSKPLFGFHRERDQGIVVSLVAGKREVEHESCPFCEDHPAVLPSTNLDEQHTSNFHDCQGARGETPLDLQRRVAAAGGSSRSVADALECGSKSSFNCVFTNMILHYPDSVLSC